MIKKVRYYIFLRDVLILALTAFGGPQAHMAMMIDLLVAKRGFLSEEDLLELYALCQILPGPTSTQTITAIGFKIGGPNLAYLTLMIWMIPAVTLMTIAGLSISILQENGISIEFTKFIQPMAVGFVSYAAYKISRKVINSYEAIIIMVVAAVASYFVRSPYIFPIILLLAGSVTAFKYKAQPVEEKQRFQIKWANFILWGGVLIFAASLGGATRYLPIRLFENFYRNGSLIFGGGQVLIPMLYTEFVEFKKYLTSVEFLTGYALAQSVPGPVFSFSAYIGAISMGPHGVFGQILGAMAASLGVFLPGTFLIFFVIRIWDSLKKYRIIRASLEGVNAASSGMVAAAAILMFQPLDVDLINVGMLVLTFCLLQFSKIPAPFIILAGLAMGFIL